MNDVLKRIITHKQTELAERKAARSLEQVRDEAASADIPRNFYAAMTAPPRWALHLIAEIKKASPSAGLIREDFDPQELARIYEQAGASALSVLTDEHFFDGHLQYIAQVKQVCSLPVLRKDFIIDAYQVYEARAAGADAVLLIGEVLPPATLLDLMILAAELKMTALVEVHHGDTLMNLRSVIGFPHERYSLLGINNRDLDRQVTDISTTFRLLSMLDDTRNVVSESGIKTNDDIQRLAQAGITAVLVGETFMKAPDVGAKVHEVMGSASR